MYELAGMSFIIPVTRYNFLSSALNTLPIGSSLPKNFFAVVSDKTIECASVNGSRGLPSIKGKVNMLNKEASARQLCVSVNFLPLYSNMETFPFSVMRQASCTSGTSFFAYTAIGAGVMYQIFCSSNFGASL